MIFIRYKIKPLSFFATTIRSDTLYGQILCTIAELNGQDEVKKIIHNFVENRFPFKLSSAFPRDYLPIPILPSIRRERFSEMFATEKKILEAIKNYKKYKKKNYIHIGTLQSMIDNKQSISNELLFEEYLKSIDTNNDKIFIKGTFFKYEEPHCSIDRITGSVLKEGGLFFSKYNICSELDLYVEIAETEIEWFDKLLLHIAQNGFGADISTGKGRFTFERENLGKINLFTTSGNAFMTLSVTSTKKIQEIKGTYKTFVKRGYVWNGFAEKNPFKKPFLAFHEGSVFTKYPTTGTIFNNIHSNSNIIQVLVPLMLPLNIVEDL